MLRRAQPCRLCLRLDPLGDGDHVELPPDGHQRGHQDLIVRVLFDATGELRVYLDDIKSQFAQVAQRAHAAANQLKLLEAAQIAQIYQQAFDRPIPPQPPPRACL